MLPQHCGRSMVASLSDLPGRSHVSPASRFSSEVMPLRASRRGRSLMTSSGATLGAGGDSLVVTGAPDDAVAGAVAWLDRETSRVVSVAHPVSATTVSTMNAYDRDNPTSARSRPSSPVRLICERPRCPRIAPTGANTNANTSDNVAKVLTGGRCGGGGDGMKTGGPEGGPAGGSAYGTRPSGS